MGPRVLQLALFWTWCLSGSRGSQAVTLEAAGAGGLEVWIPAARPACRSALGDRRGRDSAGRALECVPAARGGAASTRGRGGRAWSRPTDSSESGLPLPRPARWRPRSPRDQRRSALAPPRPTPPVPQPGRRAGGGGGEAARGAKAGGDSDLIKGKFLGYI